VYLPNRVAAQDKGCEDEGGPVEPLEGDEGRTEVRKLEEGEARTPEENEVRTLREGEARTLGLQGQDRVPVVVLVSGGAWIIGYKFW
jgi:hypothetical protein